MLRSSLLFRFFLVFCFLISSSFSFNGMAQSGLSSDFEALSFLDSVRGPFFLRRAVLSEPEFREALREEGFSIESSGLTQSQTFQSLQEVLERYKSQREVEVDRIQTAKKFEFLVQTGLSVSGGFGAILGGFVSEFVGQAIGLVEEQLKTAADFKLRQDLANYREQTQDHLFEDFKGLRPGEIFLELNAYESPIYSEYFSRIPEEARAFVNTLSVELLSDWLLSDQLKDLVFQNVVVEEIQENAQKIVSFARTLNQFQDVVFQGLDKIQDTQLKFIEAFKNLDFRVLENTQSLSGLQALFLNRLTPKEILEAFEVGFLPPDLISDSQRKVVELQAYQQEIFEEVGTILRGIGTAVQLLNEVSYVIDIPKDVLEIANTAVSLGNILYSTGTAFSAVGGGVQGVIAGGVTLIFGVLGFFLGRRGSGASQSQKQILKNQKALFKNQKQILENQKAIFEGLRAVTRNQEVILSNQERLFERQTHMLRFLERILENQGLMFESLNEKLDVQHKEMVSHFVSLHNLVGSLAFQDFNNCIDLVYTLKQEKVGSDANFLGYKDYQRILNSHPRFVESCFTGILHRTSMSGAKFDQFFVLKNDLSGTGHRIFSSDFLKQRDKEEFLDFYSSALSLFQEHYEMIGAKNLHIATEQLSLVSEDFLDLDQKLKEMSSQEKTFFGSLFFRFDRMKDFLHTPALATNFYYVLEMLPFLEMVDHRSNRVLDYEEMIQQPIRKEGLRVLERLRLMVKIHLAQWNLLSGDLLLPIFSEILLDSNHPSQSEVKSLLESAGKRSPLSKNFVLYVIRRALKEMQGEGHSDIPFDLYKEAYESYDVEALNFLITYASKNKERYKVELDESFTYQLIGSEDLSFPLPNPSQVEKGEFVKAIASSESLFFDLLRELNEKIDESLLDHKLSGELTEEEQSLMNRMLFFEFEEGFLGEAG